MGAILRRRAGLVQHAPHTGRGQGIKGGAGGSNVTLSYVRPDGWTWRVGADSIWFHSSKKPNLRPESSHRGPVPLHSLARAACSPLVGATPPGGGNGGPGL